MSLATIHTRATLGIQAPNVTVEVHISNGLPALVLVGLPETTVKEARDRVRSALINSGLPFPLNGLPSVWHRQIYRKKVGVMISLSH